MNLASLRGSAAYCMASAMCGRCVFVANAYAAFDQISRSGFDAIVVDVKMPCMDGFKLLEKVRNIEGAKNIPVLIITGEADSHLNSGRLIWAPRIYWVNPSTRMTS